MKKFKIACSILAIAFGIFMVIYGGIDDNPGGQLLGLILVILGVMFIIRNKK